MELTANPDFCYYPQGDEHPTTSTTTTTTNVTGTPTPFNATLAIAAGAVGAAVVILVGGVGILKQERMGSN